MSWEPERVARAALAHIIDPGDARLAEAIGSEGAEAVLQALLAGPEDSAWAGRARSIDLAGLEGAAAGYGLRYLIPGDEEWPEQLAELATCPPVQQLSGCPVGLWVAGPGHLGRWSTSAVAIVGARAATGYGEEVAAELAHDLAGGGLGLPGRTIISGGAYGVDAAAHRGALSAAGRTIGVFAQGLDQCYPRGNQHLFEQLLANQLVVSEVPPGRRPTRIGFLARNRLIAALGAGVVVVEAAARSGARNTSSWASVLGRVVMAVPGPVHSGMSVTPHRMIRDGEAVLVADACDVGALLAPMGLAPELPFLGAARQLDQLAPALACVREALPHRGAADVDQLVLRSGRSHGEVLAALAELEVAGLVKGEGSGVWRLDGPRTPWQG